ncbi:MAG: hypothetical protein ACJ0UT_11565, partial [Candidatus Latescibacterota bacterium]
MDYFRAKRYLDLLPDWEVGRPAHGPVEDYLPRMRALLGRLQNPQERFRSLIVGGYQWQGHGGQPARRAFAGRRTPGGFVY